MTQIKGEDDATHAPRDESNKENQLADSVRRPVAGGPGLTGAMPAAMTRAVTGPNYGRVFVQSRSSDSAEQLTTARASPWSAPVKPAPGVRTWRRQHLPQ